MQSKGLHEFACFDNVIKFAYRDKIKKDIERMLYNADNIAILDIEIENVQMIDDTFGHAVGEQVIIKSAEILKDLFEECFYVSRSGEREIVIALPRYENNEQIKIQAKKIINSFSEPLLIDTGIEALFVTVIVGIALYPEDGKDADTLLENAHLAVHEAKNTDNKIAFYTERIKARIAETTLLTNRLFRSLQKEEFFLEFQPQINCETGKIAGVEALLRLKSDGDKKVEPDEFVPILESTGLIHDVGIRVLEHSLQEHKRLVLKGFLPLRFSVNVSVVQLRRDNFVDAVVNIIKESQVDPKYIELEITEGALSENLTDMIEKMAKLKELGISIAIDDFGKGYSSLHRLESIPFDRIKIDKSIIDNIDLEGKNVSVAEIVILLAKAFKVHTTAEGVETKEHVEFLKKLGCDEIQGYYFSKPLSAERLEEFLRRMVF